MKPKRGSRLRIQPASANVGIGGRRRFRAVGGVPPHRFRLVTNSSGGTISAGGIYVAGPNPGTDVVRVTDKSRHTADARVTVTAPLTLTPAAVSQVCGGTQSFRAAGGSPPYAFDWAPGGNSSGGSIGAGVRPDTGAYVAGQTPGTDRVRVSDTQGESAEATIDVVARLELTADDTAVVVGTTTQLTGDGGSPPVTFAFASAGDVSGGSVDRDSGEYTAGPDPGTDTVEVTDDVGRTASMTLEVKPALELETPSNVLRQETIGGPMQITVATGVEVELKIVGGVPDFTVRGSFPSGGRVTQPKSGKTAFTYTAGLTVGGDRRSKDSLTIEDSQSTANSLTVTMLVTENMEDLAEAAASLPCKLPFFTLHTWHFFAGFSLHDGVIFPPPPPVPADALPCIDAGVVHLTGLQSLPSRGHAGERGPVVAPGGTYLLGRGSDAGFGVLHISIPINNILLPLVILLGESKSLFGASSVRLPCWSVLGGSDECDAACAVPAPYVPVGLNLACSDDFPLPTDVVIAPSTILVGMGPLDILGGLIDLALEYAVAGAMKALGKGAGQVSEAAERGFKKGIGKVTKEAAEKAAKEVAERVGKEVAEKAAKEALAEVGEKALKEGAEKAVKEAAEKAAKEAAEKAAKEAAEKAAREAAEKASKEATERAGKKASRKAVQKASKQAAEEAAEKAAKEAAEKAGKEAAEKAAKEAADKAVKEAAGEAVEDAAKKGVKEGAGEAAEKASFWKGVGKRLWADDSQKQKLALKSLRDNVAFTGLSDDEIYRRLANRSGWQKTWDVLKGPVEGAVIEQPMGWVGGRLGKIDDTIRGLEEFDLDDWWEFGEIIPMIESPIVQTIFPQPPAGESWWGD